MYAISMAALLRLRHLELALPRPFRTPLYPFPALWTLLGSAVCLASIAWYNRGLTLAFALVLAFGYVAVRPRRRQTAPSVESAIS